LNDFRDRNLDGGIIVFRDVHPRWSFIKVNQEGFAIECAEKRPISNLATTGLYYFKKGSDFVFAVTSMLKKSASVDGNYYICPAYNEMILGQKKIGVYEVPKQAYVTLAHPGSVRVYEEKLIARGE